MKKHNKFIPSQGLLKFVYEIHHRKKDLLNLCIKVDRDVTSNISRHEFEIIIDKFTCYLSGQEKTDLIRQCVINNSYINYLNICDLHFNEDIVYESPQLYHLNKFMQDLRQKFIKLPCISDIAKREKISPIELVNCEMNEENFRIKIFKQILDYILINNLNQSVEDFLKVLWDKYDFNNDKRYSIGELKNFMTRCGIHLPDFDLRFFFERFTLADGKILQNDFFTTFFELNQKNEHVGEYADFKKGAFTDQEIKEKDQLNEILKDNNFIKMINDSVRVFGKKYLFLYFKKYIENIKDKINIDIACLEIGYRKLGYDIVNNVEIGQFKFFCVKSKFGYLKDGKFKIQFEDLVDYLIDFFKLAEEKKKIDFMTDKQERIEGNKLKNKFNTPLFNDISLLLTDIIFKIQGMRLRKNSKVRRIRKNQKKIRKRITALEVEVLG